MPVYLLVLVHLGSFPEMLSFYSFFVEVMLFYLFPTEKCKLWFHRRATGILRGTYNTTEVNDVIADRT